MAYPYPQANSVIFHLISRLIKMVRRISSKRRGLMRLRPYNLFFSVLCNNRIDNLNQNTTRPKGSSMAEMAVQGLLEFWPCKNVNKLISGCLLAYFVFVKGYKNIILFSLKSACGSHHLPNTPIIQIFSMYVH